MKSARRQTHLVMTFVFALAAAGFGVMAGEDYNFQRESRTVIGRVLEVQEKKSESSKAAGDYFLATFSYEVGGNVYRSQQKLDRPPAPGPATVHYRPKNPLESRLEPPSPAADLLVVLACVAGAIIFGRRAFKQKGRRPPTASIPGGRR